MVIVMVNLLKIDMGVYEHLALISDRFYQGKPMLISNTYRNGTVAEEPWDTVVEGRSYKVLPIFSQEPEYQILSRARMAIGNVKYSLSSYNCEHFVSEVITGVAESRQMQKMAWFVGASITAWYIATR